MPRTTPFPVPTRVTIAQGDVSLAALKAPANRERVEALARVGWKAAEKIPLLEATLEELKQLEAEQERKKQAYLVEARQDRALAERGYRWKLKLEAMARVYLAGNDDEDDIAGRLRFGHLRVARARGVAHELHIVLPEAEALRDKLEPHGVTQAFLDEGMQILHDLGVEREETAEAKAERQKLTKKVRKKELELAQLLDELVAADEAVALLEPEEGPVFSLDVIRAEEARVEAARRLRVVAHPAKIAVEGPDGDDE